MEEKELKTSLKQRIIISLIAVVMVGSILASYAAIVINGNKGSSGTESKISEEKIQQYSDEYSEKLAAFKKVSASDFTKFIKYKSAVKAYNETTANTGGIQTKDLATGSGRTLADGDTNYLAYYIGWCADETIFDSSLDSATDPTAFDKALDASLGMIEGWIKYLPVIPFGILNNSFGFADCTSFLPYIDPSIIKSSIALAIIVAIAAPSIPNRGKPNLPKISIQFATKFTISPINLDTNGIFALPLQQRLIS